MKSIFTLLFCLLVSCSLMAQAPQAFNFQAIARDGSGNVLGNKAVGLQLSILDGSVSGPVLYAETFTVTTNEFGLFTVAVGTGAVVSGSFAGITWSGSAKYFKTEMDPNGGSNYTINGTTQLLSVPYALYAGAAGTTGGSFWTGNGNNIYNSNSGNVGIGTGTFPIQNQLQIGDPPGFSGNTLALGSIDGTQGMSFGFPGNTAAWFTGNNFSLMPASTGAGMVGIGTESPAYTLDIQSAGNSQINLEEGTGGRTATISRYTNRLEISPSDAFQVSVGATAAPHFFIGSSGNVGIGTTTPNSQLEIGSAPGFSGNNLAMGNGTQAMSFFQSPTTSTWYSNTNFALMPAGGVGNNLGIGVLPTSTTIKLIIQPISFGTGIYLTGNLIRTAFEAQTGDLDIDGGNASISGDASIGGDVTISGGGSNNEASLTVLAGFGPATPPSGNNALTYCATGFCGVGGLAIDASSGDVWGRDFYALSDERIKNIRGVSNSASDLKILNDIRITDYTMKDTRTSGGRQFKKVIAQQVEKIYPQVISTGMGFIPNVYQTTSKIEKTEQGYLLSFDSPHKLSKEAKKIQVTERGGTRRYDVLSIPNEHEVLIKANSISGDSVFVFGEQVNDLHTVDYEGLTTLNISATQELSKLVQQQAQMIATLQNKIEALEKKAGK
jgi:hypothetical protein